MNHLFLLETLSPFLSCHCFHLTSKHTSALLIIHLPTFFLVNVLWSSFLKPSALPCFPEESVLLFYLDYYHRGIWGHSSKIFSSELTFFWIPSFHILPIFPLLFSVSSNLPYLNWIHFLSLLDFLVSKSGTMVSPAWNLASAWFFGSFSLYLIAIRVSGVRDSF